MRFRIGLIAATLAAALWLVAPVLADTFFFSTGNPEGKLGAVSRQASSGKLETEVADDFLLTQTTVINQATIIGLVVPSGPSPTSITNVEVELYHVFPLDSANPPSGAVPTRVNSPADVEIAAATRDGSNGTLSYISNRLATSVSVPNTVVNGINKVPGQTTGGDGPATGDEVQITITFTSPILLPAGHYFFRPEVLVTGGDFLYLSAPKPIVSPPGTVFAGDLQAWTRNSNLNPNWLRIGTDIVGGATPPTFNMTFSISGETIPDAGTPGEGKCFKTMIAALLGQYGDLYSASLALGYPKVRAL
jgi:hypothetical protein